MTCSLPILNEVQALSFILFLKFVLISEVVDPVGHVCSSVDLTFEFHGSFM